MGGGCACAVLLDNRGSHRFCFYNIASTLLSSPFSLLAFSLRNHQHQHCVAQKPPSCLKSLRFSLS
ncbi:hypothetical protein D8674_037777 [Pyrus ussuriensis x Pyrus communis]|uniref:Uncharacterized protein n=1 Tax=Pyrus ussuriensis x Pyrus communis TaxID=2448454 RepID=A0A5N5FSK6_9ROSA|nr:hypothetical protein D8674_037777 [Pyrus ussuriensis x Pyrus communis]